MGTTFGIHVGAMSRDEQEFTFRATEHGILIFGTVTADDFAYISKKAGKKAVVMAGLCEPLAKRYGSKPSFVIAYDDDHAKAWDDEVNASAAKAHGGKQTPEAWADGADTGISSLAIYRHMTGQRIQYDCRPEIGAWCNVPSDPSDFGRCYRLLALAPEWEARLPELAAAQPWWEPLAREWPRLKALYEEEIERKDKRAPMLYEAMKPLAEEAGRIFWQESRKAKGLAP